MIKKCPKCGFKNHHFEVTSSSKCPICGVIYSKYKKRNDVLENGKPRIPLGSWGLIFCFGNVVFVFFLSLVWNYFRLPSVIFFVLVIGTFIASYKAHSVQYKKWQRYSTEKKAKELARKKEHENEIIADAKNRIYEAIENSTNFSITDSFITDNHKVFIAVDEKKRLFVIGEVDDFTDKVDFRIISTKDILGVDVATESGKSLITSAPESSLAMAALGGLLFGGAGAVVGAIAGSTTPEPITQTKEINLILSIDNINTPYIGINFLTKIVENDSNEHQQALKHAEKWFGIVKILMVREKNERGKNSDSINVSSAT